MTPIISSSPGGQISEIVADIQSICRESYCCYHSSMSAKKRLTVTVDPELVAAGQRAVASGEAESVSGWVSEALEDKVRRDRKLSFLAAAVEDFEREFGEITTEEIVAQQRIDRQDATVVRGRGRPATRKTRSA